MKFFNDMWEGFLGLMILLFAIAFVMVSCKSCFALIGL